MAMTKLVDDQSIRIPLGEITLDGNLAVPDHPIGVVLFAHGSGSSRHSPRNRFVAEELQEAHLATLLMDLLTCDEEQIDDVTRHLRFDINLLAARLVGAADWLLTHPHTLNLPIGCFGASTGAAAALIAAAERPNAVAAVVSRGGRPDLAGEEALAKVKAPTLLIVGGEDDVVIDLNKQAASAMTAQVEMQIVEGASHLFEEPGTLEEVARLAREWFATHLSARGAGNILC
jgi:dienelactone hydrolase